MVQAVVFHSDHRCVAFRSSAEYEFGFAYVVLVDDLRQQFKKTRADTLFEDPVIKRKFFNAHYFYFFEFSMVRINKQVVISLCYY